ncbi:DUF397 domain-containing protein [Yinghuangia sp. YIM S09857]|uniref:DUF397 domain-containing protein n=1 Tax=Yinghuangia sp. YIM S09857 TaxID=3436929 RepID=UPI003F52A14F
MNAQPVWRKSSYSGGAQASDCVEVADLTSATGVRDSKDRSHGNIAVPHHSWLVFLARTAR